MKKYNIGKSVFALILIIIVLVLYFENVFIFVHPFSNSCDQYEGMSLRCKVKTKLNSGMSLLLLGDSIDRNMLLDWCEIQQFYSQSFNTVQTPYMNWFVFPSNYKKNSKDTFVTHPSLYRYFWERPLYCKSSITGDSIAAVHLFGSAAKGPYYFNFSNSREHKYLDTVPRLNLALKVYVAKFGIPDRILLHTTQWDKKLYYDINHGGINKSTSSYLWNMRLSEFESNMKNRLDDIEKFFKTLTQKEKSIDIYIRTAVKNVELHESGFIIAMNNVIRKLAIDRNISLFNFDEMAWSLYDSNHTEYATANTKNYFFVFRDFIHPNKRLSLGGVDILLNRRYSKYDEAFSQSLSRKSAYELDLKSFIANQRVYIIQSDLATYFIYPVDVSTLYPKFGRWVLSSARDLDNLRYHFQLGKGDILSWSNDSAVQAATVDKGMMPRMFVEEIPYFLAILETYNHSTQNEASDLLSHRQAVVIDGYYYFLNSTEWQDWHNRSLNTRVYNLESYWTQSYGALLMPGGNIPDMYKMNYHSFIRLDSNTSKSQTTNNLKSPKGIQLLLLGDSVDRFIFMDWCDNQKLLSSTFGTAQSSYIHWMEFPGTYDNQFVEIYGSHPLWQKPVFCESSVTGDSMAAIHLFGSSSKRPYYFFEHSNTSDLSFVDTQPRINLALKEYVAKFGIPDRIVFHTTQWDKKFYYELNEGGINSTTDTWKERLIQFDSNLNNRLDEIISFFSGIGNKQNIELCLRSAVWNMELRESGFILAMNNVTRKVASKRQLCFLDYDEMVWSLYKPTKMFSSRNYKLVFRDYLHPKKRLSYEAGEVLLNRRFSNLHYKNSSSIYLPKLMNELDLKSFIANQRVYIIQSDRATYFIHPVDVSTLHPKFGRWVLSSARDLDNLRYHFQLGKGDILSWSNDSAVQAATVDKGMMPRMFVDEIPYFLAILETYNHTKQNEASDLLSDRQAVVIDGYYYFLNSTEWQDWRNRSLNTRVYNLESYWTQSYGALLMPGETVPNKFALLI